MTKKSWPAFTEVKAMKKYTWGTYRHNKFYRNWSGRNWKGAKIIDQLKFEPYIREIYCDSYSVYVVWDKVRCVEKIHFPEQEHLRHGVATHVTSYKFTRPTNLSSDTVVPASSKILDFLVLWETQLRLTNYLNTNTAHEILSKIYYAWLESRARFTTSAGLILRLWLKQISEKNI